MTTSIQPIEDRVVALAGSQACFGQSGRVGVVFHRGGNVESALQPGLQRESLPAIDLVRTGNGTGRHVDRPAESDADSGYRMLPHQVAAEIQDDAPDITPFRPGRNRFSD